MECGASTIVEMAIELVPTEADTAPADVYHAAAKLRLSSDLEWRGYDTRALAYGIDVAIATARSWTGNVSAEELEDACLALECVQSARVVSYTQCSEVCPFDLAWLNSSSMISLGSAAAPPQPAASTLQRLGLVSTFHCAPNLRSWITYHLHTGIRAFYLYADTEADAAEARALAMSLGHHASACIRVIAVDDTLRREWEGLVGWSRYGPRLLEAGSAVMARQCLNAEHAMLAAGNALAAEELARRCGRGSGGNDPGEVGNICLQGICGDMSLACDWLCHCDVDEIVCVRPTTPPFATGQAPTSLWMSSSSNGLEIGIDGRSSDAETLGQLLASARRAGASAVVLVNHEAALEATTDEEPGGAPGGPRYALRSVPDCFSEVSLFKVNDRCFRSATAAEPVFIQYNNGKSMARVGIGARPHGVHKWLLPGGKGCGVILADPNAMCLLHYCDCGFPAFIAKYERLGEYPDTWFGQGVLDFRLRARDAARSDAASTSDMHAMSAMEALFRAEVLWANEARVRAQLDNGRCLRITKVADVLGRLRAAAAGVLPAADAALSSPPAKAASTSHPGPECVISAMA